MVFGTFFADMRRRNLAVLAAVAVFSVVLAAVALQQRAAMVAPKYTPQVLFPGLAHSLNEVTHIRIVSKKGTFDVVFVPNKGWVLPGRANYPASFEEVKKTLVGLAAMETIEPKTDHPDWFHYVDLDAPPKGNGVLVTLTGDRGRVLAALIAGKSEDIGDDSGAVGLFIRKPGENQSWLVRAPAEIHADQSDWMDKKLLNVDRSRVAEADVQPASGPAYSVSRAKPTDATFTVAPLPKGRELADANAPDGVASAITDFSFDDIKPAGDFDFTNAARLVTKTFDGLIVTADVVKQGDDYWARIFADSAPGKTEAAREAHDINSRANGWAFKLPGYKVAAFTTALEGLLKPKAARQ